MSNSTEATINSAIAVFSGAIAGATVQLCDARTLHAFLQVKRDFSNWIKARIRKFGFVQGEDFITISRSPDLASGNRGASIDYHLTLDMAKELSMVENNEQGRAARRYFISCEKQALAQLPAARPHNPAIDYDRISPAQAQDLKEIVDAIVKAGIQKHGETWVRFQNKFKVNSYLQLPATRHLDARQYLIDKLPNGYAGEVMDEIPKAGKLPNALVSLPTLRNRRWLLATDFEGREVVIPVPDDASMISFTKDSYYSIVERIPMERIPDMLAELQKRVASHIGAFSAHLQRGSAQRSAQCS